MQRCSTCIIPDSFRGIARDGFTMAYLVRAGRMTRDEALRREDLLARDAVDECGEVFDELDVDADAGLNRASP